MIKGVNLIPVEVRLERRWKNRLLFMRIAAVLYLGALIIVYANQHAVISEKSGELRALAARRDLLMAQSAGYKELKDRFGDLQRADADMKKRLGLAASIEDKKTAWSAILRRLSRDTPGGVWLKGMSTSDDRGAKKVKFAGSAITNPALSDFIFQLENNGIFEDVALIYSQKRDFDKATVYDFEITAAVKKTGP